MLRKPYALRYQALYRTVPEDLILDELELAGWAFNSDFGTHAAARQACERTLEDLLRCGLECEISKSGARLFDPVEVNNALKETGLSGRTDFLHERSIKTGRALVASWTESDSHGTTGPYTSATKPGLHHGETRRSLVSWSRRFGAGFFSNSGTSRFRLPIPPKNDPDVTANLVRTWNNLDGASVNARSAWLELRCSAPARGDVELGAEFDVTSWVRAPNRFSSNPSAELPLTERELYLRPTEGLVCVTPKIRDAAEALSGGRKGEEAMRIFWLHLLQNMTCGRVHYDQLPATPAVDWVFDHGWFDCRLGSALLTSLCRAVGIPARLVGGHVLYPLAPTNHYWMEAWLAGRGWVPFDLLCWDLSAGGEDLDWRDHFFGRLDGRFVTHRFPRQGAGPTGVTMPEGWYLLQRREHGQLVISLCSIDGRVILEDRIRCSPSKPMA